MQSDIFFTITSVAFFIWAIRSVLFWIRQWQRLLSSSFFRRNSLFAAFPYLASASSLVTWFTIVTAVAFMVTDFPSSYYQSLVASLLAVKAGMVVWAISTNRLVRPRFDYRAIFVIITSLLLTCLLFAFPLAERYFWLLILDRLLFWIVVIPLVMTTFPGEIFDDLQIHKISRRLKSDQNIQTVLVVGDNAVESSEYIYQLIHRDKSSLLINERYVRGGEVAKRLNKELTAQTEVIILSLDSSQAGQIGHFMATFHPSIIVALRAKQSHKQILTNISAQLSKDSRIFLDVSYKEIAEHVLKKRKKLYFSSDTTESSSITHPSDITQTKDSLSFHIQLPAKELKVKVPFIGESQVGYLVPGIVLADHFGMTLTKIQKTAENLSPVEGSLVPHKLHSGVLIIDGSQISTLPLEELSITYLNQFKKQRVIVLGVESVRNTSELAKLIKSLAPVCTKTFVLNEKYYSLLRKQSRVGSGAMEVIRADTKQIIRFVRDETDKGDVVVFLGNLTEQSVTALLRSSSTEE